MTTSGTVLGCLCFSTPESEFVASLLNQGLRRREIEHEVKTRVAENGPFITLPRMDFPFTLLDKSDTGNHLSLEYDTKTLAAFDYTIGGKDAEHHKAFVPSRGLQISGFRVGETTGENLAKTCIQYLLSLNVDKNPEDASRAFADLAFDKIFAKIQERFFLSLEVTSTSPKFVIMTRDMPVYFLGFCDDECSYLMWSNEDNMQERLKEHYGERFYFFKMNPMMNGMCVIQPVYLKKKIVSWHKTLKNDKLKIMNALEVHLSKRLITE